MPPGQTHTPEPPGRTRTPDTPATAAVPATTQPEPTFTPGPGRSDRLELDVTQTGDLDCNTNTLTITISAHVQRQGDPFPSDATVTVDAPQHMTFPGGSTEETYDLREGQTLTITFVLIPGPYASTAAGRAKSNYSRAYPFIVHLRDCLGAQVETPTATPGIVGDATAPAATASAALGVAGQQPGPMPVTLPVTGAALDQRSLLWLLGGLVIVLAGLTLNRRRRMG